jgi:hypothetical protein
MIPLVSPVLLLPMMAVLVFVLVIRRTDKSCRAWSDPGGRRYNRALTGFARARRSGSRVQRKTAVDPSVVHIHTVVAVAWNQGARGSEEHIFTSLIGTLQLYGGPLSASFAVSIPIAAVGDQTDLPFMPLIDVLN